MLTDTAKDAFSAYTMQKYFKPAMGKAGEFMKGLPEGLEAGKEMGLNPFQAAGDYAKSFSSSAPFAVPGGAAEAIGGLASSSTPEVRSAREMSQYLADPETGMFGEEMFSKADPSTWGRTPPSGASTLGPTPSPAGITNPVGPYGVNPVQQFGTDPLGATNISDPLSGLPSPYSPTAPSPNTYGAAVDRGRAMSGQGMLNDTIRQSLGLPTSVPDQMGGMNWDQWMGQSDNAFESFMNQGQGQEGSLFDMISPHMQQPRRMVY
jgi:hypothetical protein